MQYINVKYILLTIFLFFGMTVYSWADIDASFEPQGWLQLAGDHFVVLYPTADDDELAHGMLDHAEENYNEIADDIGYSRYQNFWTWNNRVKIILFNDQDSYVRQTGQPPWSQGFASIYSELFKSRIIVTY